MEITWLIVGVWVRDGYLAQLYRTYFEFPTLRRSRSELFRLGTQRNARAFKGRDQRLFREFLNNGFDNPSQPEGHITGQRNGTALDAYTSIPLLESPVGIQPPQEPVTCVRGQYLFIRASRVFSSEIRVVYE